MAVRIILLNRAVSNDRPYFVFCSVRVHIAGGIWQAIYV